MVMEGRKYRDENFDYRYGFNGKEDDKDFGDKQLIQDYGFRLYNPAIARFLSVDPLAPSYPWNSVYAFAEGDVISCIDLDGLEKVKVISIWVNSPWIGSNLHKVRTSKYIQATYFKEKWAIGYLNGKTSQSYTDPTNNVNYINGLRGNQNRDLIDTSQEPDPVFITGQQYEEESIYNSATSVKYQIYYYFHNDPDDHSKGLNFDVWSFTHEEKNWFVEKLIAADYDLHNTFTSMGLGVTASGYGLSVGAEFHYLVKGPDRWAGGFNIGFDPFEFRRAALQTIRGGFDISTFSFSVNTIFGSSSLAPSKRTAESMNGYFVDTGLSLGWFNYSYTQNLNTTTGQLGEDWRMNNIGVNLGFNRRVNFRGLSGFNPRNASNFRLGESRSFGLGSTIGHSFIW